MLRSAIGLVAFFVAMSTACGGDDAVAAAEGTTSTSSTPTTTTTTSAATTTTTTTTTSGADETGTTVDGGGSAGSTGTTDGGAETTGGVDVEHVFVEVAAQAGVDFVQGQLTAPPDCLVDAVNPPLPGYFCSPERYAGGAAAEDYDGDGDIDLYVTRTYDADLLYENQSDGTFVDVAADVGLGQVLPTNGVAWGDVDGDGDLDLVLTSIGDLRHYLFINDDGQFVEEGEQRGAGLVTPYQHTGSTAVFGDVDLDGDLDLYLGEWRTLAVGTHPSHARLLLNLGPQQPGYFEDVTDDVGLNIDDVHLSSPATIEGTFVLSAGFGDIDGDGYPELMLANDFQTSRLFWNQGDGSFLDGTEAAGVGTDENGMGAALGDYDRDGDLDWLVTSIHSDTKTGNRLYRYEGNRTFADATDEAGVRDTGWGWGASFFDHDNDGDLDVVATNGWYATDYLTDEVAVFTSFGDGTMLRELDGLGIVDDGQGRALLTFDYDDDGDLDVFIVNNAGTARLFRNDGVTGSWLRVRAPGTTSNTDGIGARITVTNGSTTQLAEIGGTSHYLGHGPREAHFGLGDVTTVDEVHVTWPASGQQVVMQDVAVDQVLVIEEP